MLVPIVVPSGHSPPCVEQDVDSKYVFADGGQVSSTLPLIPDLKRKVKVLSVRRGDLYVPNSHLANPSKDLIYRSPKSSLPVVIVPPLDTIKPLYAGGRTLINAWDTAV